MAKKPTKAPAKKAVANKATAPSNKTANQPVVQPGDKVMYTFTDEEMKDHERQDHTRTVEASVARVISNGEVVITCDSRPGQPWTKGCFYSANKEKGCWYK